MKYKGEVRKKKKKYQKERIQDCLILQTRMKNRIQNKSMRTMTKLYLRILLLDLYILIQFSSGVRGLGIRGLGGRGFNC